MKIGIYRLKDIKRFLLNKLRNINKGLVLTVMSVLLGAFGLWGIFYEPKASISIVNISETNVLDIYEPLEDLSIYFKGEDIQEKNLGLRIYTFRVINDGGVNILQTHYDVDDIWGIKIENGDIFEVRLVDSNSDYILSNLNPRIIEGQSVVQFEKIIFEKQDFFTVEVLILYEKTKLPEIIPLGKIAGIDKLTVTKVQDIEKDDNFISQLFYGNIGVQFVRILVYLGGFFIVLLFAAMIVTIIRRPFIRRLVVAKTELTTIQTAVNAMMVDNGLQLLSNPVTTPTNNMEIFPDFTPAASKGLDAEGNAFSVGDKDGFILYKHDFIADGNDSIQLVNYTATPRSAFYYTADSDGRVIQHDINKVRRRRPR